MIEEKKELFAIFAEVEGHEKPLILSDLTFARLIDDVVYSFKKEEPFFIDGVPATRGKIRKLKILRQKENFPELFIGFHNKLRRAEKAIQKNYGDQYHIRLEANLREGCEDVTSQIIKAFDTKIKPSLKDYLPKKEELIQATSTFFWEGIKRLSGS